MITYSLKGEPFYSERNILIELSEKHDTVDIGEGIRKSGYDQSIRIGNTDVADIEMFFSTEKGTDFAAIAMVCLGENIEGYVFSKHHDAMVFLKEFVPMIESIANTHRLAQEAE